jgi:hypothetical protein
MPRESESDESVLDESNYDYLDTALRTDDRFDPDPNIDEIADRVRENIEKIENGEIDAEDLFNNPEDKVTLHDDDEIKPQTFEEIKPPGSIPSNTQYRGVN